MNDHKAKIGRLFAAVAEEHGYVLPALDDAAMEAMTKRLGDEIRRVAAETGACPMCEDNAREFVGTVDDLRKHFVKAHGPSELTLALACAIIHEDESRRYAASEALRGAAKASESLYFFPLANSAETQAVRVDELHRLAADVDPDWQRGPYNPAAGQ